MKTLHFIAPLLLVFLSETLVAQVKIEGELWLGDTTQNHVLVTWTGNRHEGRVLEFGEKKILFLEKEKRDTLSFSLGKVHHIEVKAKNMEQLPVPLPAEKTAPSDALTSATEFTYVADESDEDQITGTLVNYSFGIFRLKKKFSTELIHREKLIRLQLSGKSINLSETPLTKLHVLRTKERNDRHVGQVLSSDGALLRFLSQSGSIMHFWLEDVLSIYLEDYTADLLTELNREMPKLTGFNRIFISPSAFSNKKGTTEYRNVFIYYNSIHFAPSDHFNVELVPLLPIPQLSSLGNMKWTVDVSDMLHLGLGAQGVYAFKSQFVGEETLGILYGMASVGDEDHYVNLGIGRGDASFRNEFNTYFIGASMKVRTNMRLSFEYIMADETEGEAEVIATAVLKLLKKRSYYKFGVIAVPYKRFYFPIITYNLRLK